MPRLSGPAQTAQRRSSRGYVSQITATQPGIPSWPRRTRIFYPYIRLSRGGPPLWTSGRPRRQHSCAKLTSAWVALRLVAAGSGRPHPQVGPHRPPRSPEAPRPWRAASGPARAARRPSHSWSTPRVSSPALARGNGTMRVQRRPRATPIGKLEPLTARTGAR